MSDRDPRDDAVVARFLQIYLDDVDRSARRTREEYLALFPGRESTIERELDRLQFDDADATELPGSSDADSRGFPRIRHFEIERELGRGGQATVYLATDTRLRRQVALKILTRLGPESVSILRRFQREAEATSRLNHPGICAVLDSGIDGAFAYIAMRYVEGETLAERIGHQRDPDSSTETSTGSKSSSASSSGPSGREELNEVLRIVEKTAAALHTAHEAGVIHRDVKPGNVMITPDGDPVLLDFGLAREDDSEDQSLTRTGEVFGTPAYMPPEQLLGQRSRLDRRADVYSLGVTLFEALTLRRPFEAPTRDGLYRAILHDEAPDPRGLNPALPSDLKVVLATVLEKDPDQRYQSAADLAEDLRRVRCYEPIRARPPGRWVRFRRWSQRNPAIATGTAASFLVLLAALVATLLYLRESEENRIALKEKSDALTEKTQELQDSLDDIVAGRKSLRRAEVERLVSLGFQRIVSASLEGAGEPLEKALALDPRNKDALVARVWLDLSAPDRAAEALTRFGGPLGEDPDVVYLHGLVAGARGDSDEAQRLFETAGPSRTDVRAFLDSIRAGRDFGVAIPVEDKRRSLELIERAILRSPRPRFHYYGVLMMVASRLPDEEALIRGEEALTHHWPDSPYTWELVAQHALPRDPEKARRAAAKIQELRPEAASPHLLLAHLENASGNPEGARAQYDRAVEKERNVTTLMTRGMFLLRTGDPDRALEDFRACAVLDPEQTYVKALIRQAEERIDGAQEDG